MTARTVPTMPTWTFQEEITSTLLNQITTYTQFWANPPMIRMYQAVSQSVPNITYTQLTLDTLVYDTDSGRGTSTPWSYTIPVGMTGRWQWSFASAWASNTTGFRVAALYQNGSQVSQMILPPASASGTDLAGRTVTIPCSAGDVIALYGYQSSGGALSTDVGTAGSASYLEGRLVSLANP